VLNISANDPMGLAGIHADLRALHAMNVHGGNVITATTAQTQHEFYELNAVSAEAFKSQLDALYKQDVFTVIKIGLISNSAQANILMNHPILKNKQVILDPVLAASSGGIEQFNDRIRAIKNLMPLLDMVTPNYDEVLAIVGVEVESQEALQQAAQAFIKLGASSVLIKGGHGSQPSEDYFYSDEHNFYLRHTEHDKQFTRGTGCIYASLIAGSLALGGSLLDSVVMAKMQLDAGFKQRFKLDNESGSLQPPKWQAPLSIEPDEKLLTELPQVYGQEFEQQLIFQTCSMPLGLYPVVDRAQWLSTLLPLGVKIIQLRIKDLKGAELKREIQEGIKIARQYNAQLFINDYWQLAIECEAYGVHLGQEDLDSADLKAISQAGLRLGLSSHCFFEVARAKTIKPSYIAFGPVYETQSKDMPWIPQGPQGLQYWRLHLPNFPMVAIGGIHGDRFQQVKEIGVESIAMISAITEHNDPEFITQQYIKAFESS
jgi:hydroxymethylpyrimidine kinase/phosphomethylpyrimidine kinase/thiamine-phosphate diphosphorylase